MTRNIVLLGVILVAISLLGSVIILNTSNLKNSESGRNDQENKDDNQMNELSNPIFDPISTTVSAPEENAISFAIGLEEKYLKVPMTNISLVGDYFSVDQNIIDAIKLAVNAYSVGIFKEWEGYNENGDMEIKDISYESNRARFTIGMLNPPEDIEKKINSGEITEWGSPMRGGIAIKVIDSHWVAVLDKTEDYERLKKLINSL
jgi:hypothetical protein